MFDVGDGSSPLTRGKLRRPGARPRVSGLIPAHAGKTAFNSAKLVFTSAHPRSRGENQFASRRCSSASGSSPLTRGKRDVGQHVGFLSGLIPAHAGKTYATARNLSRPSAHPRSRGENRRRGPGGPRQRGSSPLTRGKLRSAATARMSAGLIPAHAGKTRGSGSLSRPMTAHPRSRGENASGISTRASCGGSSPLTRGKPVYNVFAAVKQRLIPAHAGKTMQRYPDHCGNAAHPRSRGENDERGGIVSLETGSSPLTRGKRAVTPPTLTGWGLIPAHAGKTGNLRVFGHFSRAHPRSRGENARAASTARSTAGSSPLTRGKHVAVLVLEAVGRLIPAHAGKTQ